MKSSRLLVLIASACLLLAGLQARADVLPTPAAGARGVYVNGSVYRVVITGGRLSMQIGAPQNQSAPYTAVDRTFVASKPPVTSSFYFCQVANRSYGGGIAVFNGKIYYAYTAVTPSSIYGCASTEYSSPHVFVATFDPASDSWLGEPREMPVGIPQERRYATGAALTVFNGRLYLFAGLTFTSGKPEEGWTYLGMSGLSAPGYEPLDAVTIYRPDAPPGDSARILIVYGKQTPGSAGYYSGLAFATWDGKTGATIVPTPISLSGQNFSGQVSLQTGTAVNLPYTVMNSQMHFANFEGVLDSPAVQLFAVYLPVSNIWDRGYVMHFEHNVSTGTWTQDSNSFAGTNGADLWTYSWYAKRCDETNASAQSLHQFIVVNYLNMSTASAGSSNGFAYDSDSLVPQNHGSEHDLPITCSDPGGTTTPTGSLAVDIARHYWSLVGVVLGSPPFAVNHLPKEAAVEAKELSNLDYASESETGITHSQEWGSQFSLSAGLEVSAGFFGVGEVSNSFDIGYKHAEETTHESESTGTVGFGQKMGTNAYRPEAAPEDDPNLGLGRYGWAFFNGPTIKVQNYAVYGYNYDHHTGTVGTYLKQDLATISGTPGRSSMRVYAFDLKDPSKGDIPGLMAGMPGVVFHPDTGTWGFPGSTDLNGWSAHDWESNSGPWQVLLGRGTASKDLIPVMIYGADHNPSVSIASTEKNITSHGETNSLEISNTLTVSAETGFGGIKADLKVGAESSFKTATSDMTSLTTEVKAALNMGRCGIEVEDRTDCVASLEVQPFVLQATDQTAPWIPETFRGQRPWAITWQVDRIGPDTAATALAATRAAAAAAPQGVTFGKSLPPRHASGRIVGGQGGGDRGDPLSRYSLEGGRMSWVDANGSETRIPMTADSFEPSKGVSFEIGRFSWSSLGAVGTWTRTRDVWTFKSGGQVKQDRVTLKLDFDDGTFNLNVDKVDFQGSIRAGVGEIPMRFIVNGQYSFRTVLNHDFDVTWQLAQAPINDTTLQVTSFDGRYNNATESGKMLLSGTLPAVLPAFGDVALKMNDRTLMLPLLSMDGFREAFESGGVFKYVKEGLNLNLDFGNKTWSATFNNKAFQKLLALRWGGSRIQVNVGGSPWYNREHAVGNFTANLTLHN